MTTTRRDLDAQIGRILSSIQVVPDRETLGAAVKCFRCKDTGLMEFVAGEFVTVGDPKGRRRGSRITATDARPVYRRCDCIAATGGASEQPAARRSFSAAG